MVAERSWWQRLLTFGPAEARPDAEVVFPPGFLESIERLRVLAVRTAGGGMKVGHRLGAYKGGQLEFADYRSYAAGDDLRYLDWNLYARLGKPFVKEFAREEAGHIHLLLDATPSMALGAPSKWIFARRLAALFGHIGWSAKDRVSARVYRAADAPLASYPPRGAKGTARDFIEWLRRQPVAAPQHGEGMTGEEAAQSSLQRPAEGALRHAVREFLRAGPARGRVFVISDFWCDEAEAGDAFGRLSAAGFDLAAVHVLAGEEAVPPEPGELRVTSLEEPGEVELHATPAAALRYQEELDAHRAAIEQSLRRRGGLYLYERSDTSLERVLMQTLRKRRWLS